ncbi:Myb-like DNA-binding domain protein [Mortierella polycephala]|uniref:Myb-like DNA-binding domain protein n=1 Tax=Mortierella polycephala TaxID=41804 RepID=A0A9P6TX50_9FUNG|nr:Myb-like DNA-binding domain protein [Mortierella polycephala]
MRVRSELRIQHAKEGFSAYHRDQLVRAVRKQLAARRTTAGPGDDSLALLGMDGKSEDSGTFTEVMGMRPTESHTGLQTSEYNVSPAEEAGAKTVDWVAIASALNNKFPATRLKSIYHELSAFRFIWTPEEDERLVRAVVRLGPPEHQPKIWTMIKDAFGDIFRTSEDYRTRWRELDMPQLDREWDLSEKIKFWRRWTEYQKDTSLFSSSSTDTSTQEPLCKTTTSNTRDNMWDQIAEGLEYRHGRDCQLYFKRTTSRFPKDPVLFQYLTSEVASVYLEPQKVHWSPQSSRLLVTTINSFLQAKKAIRWRAVANALGDRYTPEQYTSDAPLQEEPSAKPQLWTDLELELLKKGVQEYGHRWSDIRDNFLPHRNTQMISDRYLRSQAKKMGRFTEKERSLLEAAIETFGEDAGWGLIASHVPGRTANQCRQTWNYSRTHHIQMHDESWTKQDRERLKNAVARFGTKKWTLVSDFVVGKTPNQCRNEWQVKSDPTMKRNRWSGKETDLLMELVVELMGREEKEEEVSRVAAFTKSQREKEEGGGDGEDKDSRVQSGKIKFEDPMPRFKGKRKIDWKEVAKGIDGRTAEQCRLRFEANRNIYRIQGDF